MATKMQTSVFIVILVIMTEIEGLSSMKLREKSHAYQNRYKRSHSLLGQRSYTRAVQPNVVVMSSAPNTAYGGVPDVNRAPTVVVVPNDVYNTPMVANPYVVPTRL